MTPVRGKRSVEERAERLRVTSNDITRKLDLLRAWWIMNLPHNKANFDPPAETMRLILRDRYSYY